MKTPTGRQLPHKIYVGNLPHATTEADLRGLFGAAGRVRSVEIVRHQETNYPRGFGFVEMATAAEALAAIGRFNDFAIGVKRLAVNGVHAAKLGSEPRIELTASTERAGRTKPRPKRASRKRRHAAH